MTPDVEYPALAGAVLGVWAEQQPEVLEGLPSHVGGHAVLQHHWHLVHVLHKDSPSVQHADKLECCPPTPHAPGPHAALAGDLSQWSSSVN